MIPAHRTQEFNPAYFIRLVPGFWAEKIFALLKSLPKPIRKRLQPIRQYSDALYERYRASADEPNILLFIVKTLEAMIGIKIKTKDFNPSQCDEHLQMRFCLHDDGGKIIAEGRNWDVVTEGLIIANESKKEVPIENSNNINQTDLESLHSLWDFDDLTRPSSDNIITVLKDNGNSVLLFPCYYSDESIMIHRRGLARLFCLQAREYKYLQKSIKKNLNVKLLAQFQAQFNYIDISNIDGIIDDVLLSAADKSLNHVNNKLNLVWSKEVFDKRLNNQSEWVLTVESYVKLINLILKKCLVIFNLLETSPEDIKLDVEQQLQYLMPKYLLWDTPAIYRMRLPVYLSCIELRLNDIKWSKEERFLKEAAPYLKRLYARLKESNSSLILSSSFVDFRWAIEEFRVSFFGGNIKTLMPISEKRLLKFWNNIVE